jgi:transposase
VSTSTVVDTMGVESVRVPVEPERVTRNGRRFFSEEHKRAVVERCLAPGASVSAVSLAHGFNTNLVRKWIRAYQAQQAAGAGTLVPVTVREAREIAPSGRARAKPVAAQAATSASATVSGSIEIELGAAKLILRGPVNAGELRAVLDVLARYR